MGVHSLNGKRISKQIHISQISQSNKSFAPFFITAIGSGCQFDNSMQREFDIWEILLRKVMEIGISVPNKVTPVDHQFKKNNTHRHRRIAYGRLAHMILSIVILSYLMTNNQDIFLSFKFHDHGF
jgi:hypothetical protein